MRRKFLSVVLCVCMMLTMAPFAFAEGSESSSGSGSNSSSIPSANIDSQEALQAAINSASDDATIALDNDIVLTSPIIVTKTITLNMNGKTLSNTTDLWNQTTNAWSLVSVRKNGDLTITGNGTFQTKENDCYAVDIQDATAKCTIENGTFVGNIHAVYVENGIANIKGGTYSIQQTYPDSNKAYEFVLNLYDANRKNGTAKIVVTGGTFVNFDPANCQAEGINTNFCAEDYVTIQNKDNSYTVKLLKDIATARIGDIYYKSLTDAYAKLPRGNGVAPAEATTITLLADCAGGGIGSDGDNYMNYVIDFNGHTYTVGAPAVGSTGTVSQGIRVLKGSTAKFMNGTLKAANYNDLVQVVHTYGDVTFQDFTVDASEDTYAWAAVEPDNGTLNILGDSSILARTGNYGLYVAFWPRGGYTDGTTVTIDTTGKITGKLAYEWDDVADSSKQQTESKAILNIENGNFDITGIETLFTSSIPVEKKIAKINISNGYFSVDPSNYCVSGKTGISTGRADYPYTVGTKPENTEPAPVETATVPAKVSDNASQDVIDAANAMDDGADLAQNNVIEAAAKSVADNNLVKATDIVDGKTITKTLDDLAVNNSTTVSDNNVQVIYQTYVDVQVNDVKKITGDAITELEVNLAPMYRIIATTNNVYQTGKYIVDKDQSDTHNPEINAIQIGDAQKLTLPTSNYTVTLALPNNFAEDGARLSIKHTKDNGSIEYYTGSVTSTTDNTQTPAPTTYYVTFTTNGFSPFTIYASSASVASIGSDENEKVYPTLQAAIDAANDNDTITLKQDCAENVTVSRNVKFTLNNGGKSFTGTISAGSRYNLTSTVDSSNANKTTYTVTYVGGSSSGSISAPTTYAVNVNAATNGAVAADKKTASKGTTVTVTASPSKGYVVDAVKVVDKDGKDVAVTEKDGKYVFTMPASAVTVTGTFKAETPAPVALPFTDVKSGNWFYDAVKYAYAQGLMTGTSATTFAPNGTMNRAMIVTVLYRLEKSPAVTGASKFTDVPAGQWYSDAVAWAAANKIVNGYDETTFGPMNAVTREQMAAILFRYEQVKGLENVTLEENLNRFPDQNKISAYAIPALQWAVGQKIINGNADGTLDPTGTATRAQVAQIFTNLLNK